MTEAQKTWLAENPRFEMRHYLGVVSLYQWVDKGYLSPDGRFLPGAAKAVPFTPWRSLGGTLYADMRDFISVGRKVNIG